MRERLCLLEDPERELLVADAPDGLAGFIDVHVQRVVESDPYGEVGGLVVAAPHRGAGLGAALLAAAAEWSRARGLERLWIRANLARVGPHEFYEAIGCRDRQGPARLRVPAVKRIVLGDCLDVLQSLDDGVRPARLPRPAVQHRQGAGAHAPAHRARRGRRPHGFTGGRYRTRGARQLGLERRLRRLPGVPRAAARGRRGACSRPTGRSSSTSTRARHTTARCCSTSCSGASSFINEIVWAYDYGARTRTRWPAKHDVIFWYARDPSHYVFRYDDIDRVPYLAPGLVGPEKAARGKTPTDVWWQTIVSPTGKEKTGYPTQKPVKILERIVRVHSDPGDLVVDPFAGSGTTGEAAAQAGPGATCWWTRTQTPCG